MSLSSFADNSTATLRRGKSPARPYRASSVYDVVIPIGTNYKSELDAVGTRVQHPPAARSLPEDRGPSRVSEHLAGEYRAELYPPPLSIKPDRRNQGSKTKEKPICSQKQERIHGLSPAIFWIVVLLIVSLIAAGIAVGLAIGLGSYRASLCGTR